MNRTLKTLIPALAMAALSFSVRPSSAAGNIKLGPVAVHPSLEMEERYDDNIYLSRKGKKADWINQTGLGVKFDLKARERVRLDLGYKADFLFYAHAPSANNAVHQTVNAGLLYDNPKGWNLGVTEKLMDTTDPAASELVQRARRTQNDLGASFSHKLETGLQYGLSVQQTIHSYSSDALGNQLDRDEYRYGGSLAFPAAPKTKMLVGYQITSIGYDNKAIKKDSFGQELSVGVEGKFCTKLTGLFQAGFVSRHYEEDVAGLANNVSLISYKASLNWKAAERTDLTLSGTRGFAEATFGTNRFYAASGAGLQLTQKIRSKWTARVSGNYENNQYPEDTTIGTKTDKRTDNNLQGGLNLDYDIQDWLKVGASILHRQRLSNFSKDFDYRDNITAVNVKLLF